MDLFQIGALGSIFIFYLAYFIKQVMLRRKGISTNRLAKGDKKAKTFYIELCLIIVTYLTAAIQLCSIIFQRYLVIMINSSYIRALGIFIAFSGVVFFIMALIVMRDSWRAGIDNTQTTKLISSGVYKLSRNPAFVGFDLLYIGIALSFSNIFNVIISLIAVITLHLQILEEEKYLPTVFGDEYERYKRSTNRYFMF
ncbi:methyltransferase family protein [Clostridium cylindrosporum]|nr:isoprenylcysteine carboxylmethyltransferase family protein [Clostridium cylindrosporum]